MGKSANRVTAGAVAARLEAAPNAFSAQDAMLSWIQEIAPYGVFTTDDHLIIRSWNQWLASHSGIAADRIIGRKLTEVFPEVEERRLISYFRNALNGEISVLSSALHQRLLSFPVKGRREAGGLMLQTARVAPLPWASGAMGTITTIEDVTDRETQAQALHRQQEHDRLLSRTLEALLQSKDPLRDIADLFPEIGPALGLQAFLYHRFDAISRTLILDASGGVPPAQKEVLKHLALGERFPGHCAAARQIEIVENVQDRTEPFLEVQRSLGIRFSSCFPILIAERLYGTLSFGSYTRTTLHPGEITFLTRLTQYVGIAMERTQREDELRKAQSSLEEHAETLEAKVQERTARLHETIAHLESFSYTVAHDLRAPIRALKGYCEVLEEDFSDHISSEGHIILNRLRRASSRLDALTRDLLDFSKVARQNVQLSAQSVDEVVEELLMISPTLEKIVRVQKPLGVVRAHRTLLQQCLSNLLDNAQKFKTPSTELQIVIRSESVASIQPTRPTPYSLPNPKMESARSPVTASPFPGPGLRVWVEDNGIGIAPEFQERIFGIFERGPVLDRIDGTGIGLAIVARAMQQMGGNCGVESELGKGSRFWIELPIVLPSGAEKSNAASAAQK